MQLKELRTPKDVESRVASGASGRGARSVATRGFGAGRAAAAAGGAALPPSEEGAAAYSQNFHYGSLFNPIPLRLPEVVRLDPSFFLLPIKYEEYSWSCSASC